jgi:hypothetical protein
MRPSIPDPGRLGRDVDSLCLRQMRDEVHAPLPAEGCLVLKLVAGAIGVLIQPLRSNRAKSWTAHLGHLFNNARQFTTTFIVEGVESSTGTFNKNRPSGAMSHCAAYP